MWKSIFISCTLRIGVLRKLGKSTFVDNSKLKMCRELAENHKLHGHIKYTEKEIEWRERERKIEREERERKKVINFIETTTPTMSIRSCEAGDTQITFPQRKSERSHSIAFIPKQIQLHTEMCVHSARRTYKIEKCVLRGVANHHFSLFFITFYLPTFCFIVHSIPFGKVAVFMVCSVLSIVGLSSPLPSTLSFRI